MIFDDFKEGCPMYDDTNRCCGIKFIGHAEGCVFKCSETKCPLWFAHEKINGVGGLGKFTIPNAK